MLKIKLARFGKRSQPHYRIVVNEARDKRDGRYVANVGQYAPTLQPKILTVNLEEYKNWLKKGAQPTDTVAALVKRFESGNPFPARAAQPSKKVKAKDVAAKEAVIAEKAAAEAEKTAAAEEVKAAPVEATPEEAPAA